MLHYHPIDPEHFSRLATYTETNETGDEFALACNLHGTDHLHVLRVGPEGSRLEGRVVIAMHDGDGEALTQFFSASDARALAANLLDAADSLDGVTPLIFWDPDDTGDIEEDPR